MFHSRLFYTVLSLLVIAVFSASCSGGGGDISSPDGAINVSVSTKGGSDGASLVYSVTFNGEKIVSDSPLGFVLADGGTIGSGLSLDYTEITEVDNSWQTVCGKSAEVRDHYNTKILVLKSSDGREFSLHLRVYDDAVAFRYALKALDGESNLELAKELTGFRFTGDYNYWGLHFDDYNSSYETDYTESTLSNITPETLTTLPVLVKVSDTAWVGVTEANLTDYAGMYLRGDSTDSNLLSADLSPLPDGIGVCVKGGKGIHTPWRVLMIADNPGRLIESDVVLNLNEPCTFDTSWIKPGKTAWDWWSGPVVEGKNFKGGMDNRTMKHYIDFAGDYGLEYMLIDAGWYGSHTDGDADITTSIPEIDIPGLVAYANERNVDILLWLNWKCVDRQMDEAFPLYEKWGVKGIKVDYMNRDDQEMVNYYHRVAQKTAENHLMLDFHGAYKPTGIRRTYPNLITREGVMGLEYCKWSERTTPAHDCTIPFTRMLAGPIDYTPGGFSNTAKGQFKYQNLGPMTQGTRCHQLGLYVIFESPLQMLVDHPSNYRGADGIEFLRVVPATWDETKVLNGEVGDYITMARKNGDEWYLGSITNWDSRELDIDLDFLTEGDYIAEIYADGGDADANAESVDITTMPVKKGMTLTVKMAPGGGFAARFVPKR